MYSTFNFRAQAWHHIRSQLHQVQADSSMLGLDLLHMLLLLFPRPLLDVHQIQLRWQQHKEILWLPLKSKEDFSKAPDPGATHFGR